MKEPATIDPKQDTAPRTQPAAQSAAQPSEDAPPLWSWQRDRILLLTVIAVLTADQITKFAVKETLPLGASFPGEGFIRITHGANTGIAFGLFPNLTILHTLLSIVAIGFIVYFYRAFALHRPVLRFAIGLMLGGALGNLFDRIAFGAVTDFIDVGWWPIFNIADSSISVGMATLVAVLLLFDLFERKRGHAAPTAGAAHVDANQADAPHNDERHYP